MRYFYNPISEQYTAYTDREIEQVEYTLDFQVSTEVSEEEYYKNK